MVGPLRPLALALTLAAACNTACAGKTDLRPYGFALIAAGGTAATYTAIDAADDLQTQSDSALNAKIGVAVGLGAVGLAVLFVDGMIDALREDAAVRATAENSEPELFAVSWW